MLLASLFASSCNHLKQQIPNVAVYRELPFADAPEALEVWTLQDDYRILTPLEWEELRPYMLMIPPETWTAIKKSWLKACLLAGDKGGDTCKDNVHSIDSFLIELDKIVENIVNMQQL